MVIGILKQRRMIIATQGDVSAASPTDLVLRHSCRRHRTVAHIAKSRVSTPSPLLEKSSNLWSENVAGSVANDSARLRRRRIHHSIERIPWCSRATDEKARR